MKKKLLALLLCAVILAAGTLTDSRGFLSAAAKSRSSASKTPEPVVPEAEGPETDDGFTADLESEDLISAADNTDETAETAALDAPTITLWKGDAPFTEDSPDRRQPILYSYTSKRSRKSRIAVIVCAGGGYRLSHLNTAGKMAAWFRKNGISGFALDYRRAPCNCMAPLADAQRAIRVLRKKGYKYVGILGFSAGGHLACTAATHWDTGDPNSKDPVERESCRPDFFIPCYSVVSFQRFPEQNTAINLLGEHADDPDLQAFFSAELNVTPETPPAYIWHTSNDKVVSADHSLLLVQALGASNVPYELHIFAHGRHGLGLGKKKPDIKTWKAECLAFIKNVCRE